MAVESEEEDDGTSFGKAETESLYDFLHRQASMIAEHFDTVQIICTRHNDEGYSKMYEGGCGNHYARIASTDEWTRRMKRS